MNEDAAYGCRHGDVLGHEFAGEVVALGREAEGLKTGDLVSVIPLKSCGQCEHCRKGEVQWCAQFGLQGGGYAEYAVTRPNQCVRLPGDLSLDDGAIIEPLAVALHGVNLSGMKPGDKVLGARRGADRPRGGVLGPAHGRGPGGDPGPRRVPARARVRHGRRCLRGRSAGSGRQRRRPGSAARPTWCSNASGFPG